MRRYSANISNARTNPEKENFGGSELARKSGVPFPRRTSETSSSWFLLQLGTRAILHRVLAFLRHERRGVYVPVPQEKSQTNYLGRKEKRRKKEGNMKGRYSKGNFLWIRFDLKGDKDLEEAYAFYFGGSPELTKHVSEPLKTEVVSIGRALHRDALAYNEKIKICQRFNICTRCGGEIDLEKNAHEHDDNYPEMGLFCHKVCPPRRNVYLRDL